MTNPALQFSAAARGDPCRALILGGAPVVYFGAARTASTMARMVLRSL